MEDNTLHDDKLIFQRIARGDAQAFAEFYDGYAVKLALYVSRFLKSDLWAEEIVQDTFVKLWSIRETLGEIEHPAAFVYRMVANRTKDHLRHREHEIKLQQHLARYFQQTSANTTQDQLDYQTGEKRYRQAIQ